jgi:hypothetical protein
MADKEENRPVCDIVLSFVLLCYETRRKTTPVLNPDS